MLAFQIWITLLLISFGIVSIAETYLEKIGADKKIINFLDFMQQSIVVSFSVTVALIFLWLLPGIVSRW